jgi:hypothetical protein
MNFIECRTVEEANKIDLTLFSFVKFSETRQVYIFKKRQSLIQS